MVYGGLTSYGLFKFYEVAEQEKLEFRRYKSLDLDAELDTKLTDQGKNILRHFKTFSYPFTEKDRNQYEPIKEMLAKKLRKAAIRSLRGEKVEIDNEFLEYVYLFVDDTTPHDPILDDILESLEMLNYPPRIAEKARIALFRLLIDLEPADKRHINLALNANRIERLLALTGINQTLDWHTKDREEKKKYFFETVQAAFAGNEQSFIIKILYHFFETGQYENEVIKLFQSTELAGNDHILRRPRNCINEVADFRPDFHTSFSWTPNEETIERAKRLRTQLGILKPEEEII
jgi:hypothetical protein